MDEETRTIRDDIPVETSLMLLTWSRYSALVFAVGLAIGEAAINWGHWQYAPLWIVDYVIVAWLLAGFWTARSRGKLHILLSGWAFTAGVFYMALFISLDPEMPPLAEGDNTLLVLIGMMLALAVIGFLSTLLACKPVKESHL